MRGEPTARRERRAGTGKRGAARACALRRLLSLVFPLLAAACSLLPATAPAAAQTRTVEILNADLVTVEQDSLGIVRRLEGNVRLRQDTTLLSARSAVYDERASLVTLRGGVRVVSGRNTLTAETVLYHSDTRVAEAQSSARVTDGESVLTAPAMTHDTQTEVSTFAGGGRILSRGATITSPAGTYSSGTRVARLSGPLTLVDSATVLTAARGTYDAGIQRADVAGNVRLRRPDTRLDADSLVYFRTTERARAYGQAALERIGTERAPPGRTATAPADSSRRTFLFGDELIYDGKAQTAQARGPSRGDSRDPLLVALSGRSDGGIDTTLVRAPRLDAVRVITRRDTTTVLTATGGARLTDGRLVALADSAHLERRGESDRLGLFGRTRPSVWASGAQLTGDTLTVTSRGGRVDTLLVVGTAFAARVDSLVGRVQQLAGGRMQAFFEGDSLRRLSVAPNAEACTFRAEGAGDAARLAGADRLSADSLAGIVERGKIRAVRGYGGVAGTAYGPRIVPEGTRLPGYAFAPDAAPTRDGVLDTDGWEARWLARFGPTPEALRPPDAQVAPP